MPWLLPLHGAFRFHPDKELTMTQRELNRAIAQATGESVSTIERIGFLLSCPETSFDDPSDESLGPSVLDWDAFDPVPPGLLGVES